jgi:hypothetical protein
MSPTGWIVLAVVVIAIILLVAYIGMRRRSLRSRFGPEYERVAEQSGSKWRADSELAARQQRRQKLNIRSLGEEQRKRYGDQWQQVQADFVDQPYEAVASADRLVTQVMRERGYPMENFEQHANDLSVDYPELVDNYRGAHAIATQEKSANTEELRKAMLHYRGLFQELLGEPGDGQASRPEFETKKEEVARERSEARVRGERQS